MALRRLHTNWQHGSYEEDRNSFVGAAENSGDNKTRPYFDGSIVRRGVGPR